MMSIKMRIQNSNSTTSRFSFRSFLIVLLLGASISEAFVPMTHRASTWRRETTQEIVPSVLLRNNDRSRIPQTQNGATTTKLQFSWEDIVFNAQSAANNLATVSLGDPTNLLTSLPIMYAAGLLTSFSPCVWGLLPLTMSYISTAAGEREDQQTTLPTLAFAAGLAVVFCSLGVTAVELGGVFGSSSSTNIILPIFSNGICMVMGLQLLGFIELPSLDVLSPKGGGSSSLDEPILLDGTGRIIDSKRKEAEEGSLLRTFLLGGSSALVASPCATPVLTSILAFVAAAKNPALGAFLLLGYTLGYSTPLLLVASTGGKALVNLRQSNGKAGFYAKIAPWVTPLTAGVLLWYGTDGLLTSVFGDPSMAGMAVIQ
jgi:cytochrome c-type biogenesis protein